MANTPYDEFDEFLATESGDEYMTEAVGLKAVKEYFGNFKKKYNEAFKKAKEADKKGDKAAFDKAIKECKKAIADSTEEIAGIEENAILNVICPLLLNWLWIILRGILFLTTSSTDIPNQKTIGNSSKQACIIMLKKCDAEIDKYADGWADRHKVAKESVLATAVHDIITECGSISKEEYDILCAYYTEAEDDSDEKEDDSEEEETEDDKKEKDDDSEDKEDKNAEEDKLSKKAQEVMDKFDELSDKDKDTVRKLVQEHADDDDETYLTYLEAAIDVVSENSKDELEDSYTTESVIETFDCPEFTSLR